MKIGIIGCGAYAIALASILENKNVDITMWTKLESEYKELSDNNTNLKAIDYKLNNKIKFTMSLEELLQETNTLIFAIPAKFIESTAKELQPYYNNQEILIATKGLVENEYCFINKYLESFLNTDKITCISGPSFASDVIKKYPIGLTISSNNTNSLDYFKKLFSNINYLTIQVTNDIIGVELCGILKNIIAIGAGILNGMNINNSTIIKFLIDTSKEIQLIIELFKGDKNTFYTYAGIGDFILTTTNNKSRNYTFGSLIGEDKDYKSYIEETTIEGLENLDRMYNFLKNNNFNSNIITLLYDIIYLSKDKSLILKYLENKE